MKVSRFPALAGLFRMTEIFVVCEGCDINVASVKIVGVKEPILLKGITLFA
jgi:hypothetical protein